MVAKMLLVFRNFFIWGVGSERKRGGTVEVPSAFKEHWKNVFLYVLAWVILFSCLWQLEIVEIHLWNHSEYVDLPFLVKRLNVWFYRDVLFAGICLSAVLITVSLWWWE